MLAARWRERVEAVVVVVVVVRCHQAVSMHAAGLLLLVRCARWSRPVLLLLALGWLAACSAPASRLLLHHAVALGTHPRPH